MQKKFLVVIACFALVVSLLAIAGCQPKSADNAKANDVTAGAAHESAIVVEWSAGAECSACHAAESSIMTEYHAALSCESCHTDEAGLARVHEGKTSADRMPKKLKATEVEEASCVGCHEDYAALAEKTASYDALVDSNGTSVNPHDIHSHGAEEHDDVTCGSCHAEHGDDPLEESAKAVCTDCHHQNVFECYTCHE